MIKSPILEFATPASQYSKLANIQVKFVLLYNGLIGRCSSDSCVVWYTFPPAWSHYNNYGEIIGVTDFKTPHLTHHDQGAGRTC